MQMLPYTPTPDELRRWCPAPRRMAATPAPKPTAASKKRTAAEMEAERGRLKNENARLRRAVDQQETLAGPAWRARCPLRPVTDRENLNPFTRKENPR